MFDKMYADGRTRDGLKGHLGRCALAALALAASTAQAADCEALLQQHLKTDLTLAFAAFDQDDAGGWRDLDNQQCPQQAAQLIQRYLEAQPDSPAVVRWHLAQAQGAAGNTAQARATALTTLRPEPGPFPPGFRWNDYVLATVAFWDQDLPSFKHHAAQVAARTAADPVTRSMNAANAKILNKLLQCFGTPYREAMDCQKLPTKR